VFAGTSTTDGIWPDTRAIANRDFPRQYRSGRDFNVPAETRSTATLLRATDRHVVRIKQPSPMTAVSSMMIAP
jgi:hypothetical protein